MSDEVDQRSSSSNHDRPVKILHVDDDTRFSDIAKQFLERESDAFEVLTEATAKDGLDVLHTTEIDCVVSDYDMPGMDGLAFLEAVHGPYPDLPFILFTGKGSEEIASKAISKGVTDYLQKSSGTEQYEVLANRIRNGVYHYRTEHELELSRQFLSRVLNLSTAAVMILDGEGTIIRANERSEELLGFPGPEFIGHTFTNQGWRFTDSDGNSVSEDDLPFNRVRDSGAPIYDVECGLEGPDGRTRWVSVSSAPFWDDNDSLEYVVTVLSDVSSRATEERKGEKTIGDLEAFGRSLSHDLGNIFQIAQSRLRLAQETGEAEHFDAVERSLSRAVDMLDDLTGAIQSGRVAGEFSTVNVGTVFKRAWETQATSHASKEVVADIQIRADEAALLRMFENLIRNTFEHGSDSATIRVDVLPDGFYVEDNGPGIPDAEREEVFNPGYTTKKGGTGIGLPSVKRISDAHGWEMRIADSSDGGARFEFTNVEQAIEDQ